MRKNESSGFEEPAFKALLEKYEGMVKSHTPCYFDAEDLWQVSVYYIDQERMTDALKAIELCNSFHPNNTEVLTTMASILMDMNQVDKARQIADSLTEVEDENVIVLKAHLAVIDHNEPELTRLLDLLHSNINERDTIYHVEMLRLSMNMKSKELSQKWYSYLSENFDLDTLADEVDNYCQVFIDYHTKQDDFVQVAHFLQIYMDNHPMDQKRWMLLSQSYYFAENKEKALEAIDFAIAIDDTQTLPLKMKASLLNDMGRLDESIKLHEELSRMPNEDRNYHLNQIMMLLLKKKSNEDENSNIYFVDAQEGSNNNHNNMAEMIDLTHQAINDEDKVKAEYYYELAKSAHSYLPSDLFQMGNLCLDMGEPEECIKFYEIMLDQLSDEIQNHYLASMALNLLRAQRYNESFNFYTRLYMQSPESALKHCAHMLYILYVLNRKKELLSWYNEFAKTVPNLIELIDLLPENVRLPMQESIEQAKELFADRPTETKE